MCVNVSSWTTGKGVKLFFDYEILTLVTAGVAGGSGVVGVNSLFIPLYFGIDNGPILFPVMDHAVNCAMEKN